MPTPLDNAMRSRSAVLGFAGLIAAVGAWTIWGSDTMFPKEADPKGDPTSWTDDELRRWLRNRNLLPTGKETREELLARVEANMRAPKT
ncbi:MAG: hypothetical protein M1828_003896 [Chrysothrix sp. TS-e1954]|nr:MAG: hypothetical protein M1828_003896 [Chrysothrix sp. TS-e1954]